MRKFFVIPFLVLVCFLIEWTCSWLFGKWFSPNLLIILVVFMNLAHGTRDSLIAAFLAGYLKDSFGSQFFGLNIFSFVACSYLTTFLKMYIYHVGSYSARLLLVFILDILFVLIQYATYTMLLVMPVSFKEMFLHVLVPEVLATIIITIYAFEKLKKCASKLFG